MARNTSGLLRGGPGRPKGIPNKLTTSAKQAFQFAFTEIGGAKQLADWAKANPTEFYKLYSRLIPHEVTGADGGAIVIQWLNG